MCVGRCSTDVALVGGARSSSARTIAILTAEDLQVLRKEDDGPRSTAYVHAVKALRTTAGRWRAEVLIVLIACGAVIEVALREDAKLPRTTLVLALPVVALIVLPLLAWRTHGYAAGAGLWLVAGAVSFVDGRLVVASTSLQVAGLAAAYLLGNTRDLRQAQVGLGIIVACAVIVVSNDPHRTGSESGSSPGFSPLHGPPDLCCDSARPRARRRWSALRGWSSSRRSKPAKPSPRSAPASPANFTMWSVTASAS